LEHAGIEKADQLFQAMPPGAGRQTGRPALSAFGQTMARRDNKHESRRNLFHSGRKAVTATE
jgi:hypothetical protein